MPHAGNPAVARAPRAGGALTGVAVVTPPCSAALAVVLALNVWVAAPGAPVVAGASVARPKAGAEDAGSASDAAPRAGSAAVTALECRAQPSAHQAPSAATERSRSTRPS
jgi:hypothetical protein